MSLCFNEAANQKPIVQNDCQPGGGGWGGGELSFVSFWLSFPFVASLWAAMNLVPVGLRKSLSRESWVWMWG